MKYLLVLIVVSIGTGISVYTHLEAKRLSNLTRLLDSKSRTTYFTQSGKINIIESYKCLHLSVRKKLNLDKLDENTDDRVLVKFVQHLIAEYPVRLLGTKETHDGIEVSALFNSRNSVKVTFLLKREQNEYRISRIENLCQLFSEINDWYVFHSNKKNE